MKKNIYYEIIVFIIILIITIAGPYFLYKFIVSKKSKTDSKFSIDIEKKLKDLIKKQIMIDSKVIDNNKIKTAIDEIKKRLESNIENKNFDLEIIVIDSEEVNAVSLPGGLIILYSSLISITENPEQLAAVIAHEIGHVVNRDSINALKRNIGLAIILSGIGGNDSSDLVKKIIQNLINNSYSRKIEEDTDDFACQLLIKSSINPKNLEVFFKKLKEINNIKDKNLLKYLGSHPDIDSRIEKARQMSELFRGEEEKFNIDWKKIKKELPSLFN